MSISNTTHDYCYRLCAGRAIARSRLVTDSAPLTLSAAEQPKINEWARRFAMSRCPEPPGWSKSAKGSPSTTCQGGRSKHASRGPRRQREGPADREQEDGGGRGARRGWSVGRAGCPEKRGAYLLVGLSSQPPSSGGHGRARSTPGSRPMRIDDEEGQEGAVGTPKATSSTRAAYASF